MTYKEVELQGLSMERFINFEKAWKGIFMGVALGEDYHAGVVHRHYLMCSFGWEAREMRRRVADSGKVHLHHPDMYDIGKMMEHIELGGMVILWEAEDGHHIVEDEVADLTSALRGQLAGAVEQGGQGVSGGSRLGQ